MDPMSIDPNRPIFRMDPSLLTDEERGTNAAHAEALMDKNTNEMVSLNTEIKRLIDSLRQLNADTTKGVFGRIKEETNLKNSLGEKEFRLHGLQNANERLKKLMDANISAYANRPAGVNKFIQVQSELRRGIYTSVDADIKSTSTTDYDKNGPKMQKESQTILDRLGQEAFRIKGNRSELGDRRSMQEAWGIAKAKMSSFFNGGAKTFGMLPSFLKGGNTSLKTITGLLGKFGPWGKFAATASEVVHKEVKATEQTATRINSVENEALGSGLNSQDLIGLKAALKRYGGGDEAASFTSRISSQLGGMQFGIEPTQLLNLSKYYGIKLSGSGVNGMPTTDEILGQIAEVIKNTDKNDRERLSLEMKQFGITGAMFRLMEKGSDSLQSQWHSSDWITRQMNTPEAIANAEEVSGAKAQAETIMEAVNQKFMAGDMAEGWHNFLSNWGSVALSEDAGEFFSRTASALTQTVMSPLGYIADFFMPKGWKMGDMKKIASDYKNDAIDQGDSFAAAIGAAAEQLIGWFSPETAMAVELAKTQNLIPQEDKNDAIIKRTSDITKNSQEIIIPDDNSGRTTSVKVDQIVVNESKTPKETGEAVAEELAQRMKNWGPLEL